MTTPALNGPTAQVGFKINLPSSTTAAVARTPQFISPATASVKVAIGTTVLGAFNITPSSPNCTTVNAQSQCTLTVSAPIGTNTYTITTFDGANATGNQLSTASVSTTIAANATNTVAMTLQGVVASATAQLSANAGIAGTAATAVLTVTARDASGNAIVGAGNYSSPVTIANSDTSGATTLSSTAFAGPGSTATLTYTGKSLATVATLTPFIGSAPGTAATYSVTGSLINEFALPPNTFGGYVQSMAVGPDGKMWYGGPDIIGNISTSGAATQFTAANGVPGGTNMYALTAGPGNSMYFGNDSGAIGTIDTSGNVVLIPTFNQVDGCTGSSPPVSVARRGGESQRRAQSGPPPGSLTCGAVSWIARGPDGNYWFTDNAGYIGNVTPAGVASEWDIRLLPGWTGSSSQSDPFQIAFGPDGTLYVPDDDNGIDRITVSGGVPTGVTLVTSHAGAQCADTFSAVLAPDNDTLWFADDCDNVGALSISNFTGAQHAYSIDTLTSYIGVWLMAGSTGGVWFVDGNNSNLYRISGATAAANVETYTVFTDGAHEQPQTLAQGADLNMWVDAELEQPNKMTSVTFGLPSVTAASLPGPNPGLPQSLRRSAALPAAGSAMSAGAKRRHAHGRHQITR